MWHHLLQDLSVSLEVQKSKLGQTNANIRQLTSRLKFMGSSKGQMDKQPSTNEEWVTDTLEFPMATEPWVDKQT